MVTQTRNTLDTFALSLACMLEGVIQVPFPPELPARERLALLADAQPLAVVVEGPSPALPGDLRELRVPPDGFASLPPTDPGASWPRTRPMAYTSGTSGRRKGVHVGVHGQDWGHRVIQDEHAAFDHRHGGRHLVVSPLYHSGPLRHAVVTALTGGRVIVMERFDVSTWQHLLRTHRPTSLFCVPTHLHRLLAHPDTDVDMFASLRLLAHAGAPCPTRLKEHLLTLAPEGAAWEFYGSTEGQFTVCPPDVWQRAPGTVGQARTGTELDVRDAGPDGVGTVWARVPDHARWEYWRQPARTADAWDGDAFTVGDLGRLQQVGGQRLLFLHGRPGDLVISGGVNVYPAEVEQVLLDHPHVAEVAVYGVPDDGWGERVVAAVVLHRSLPVDDLQRFAQARLRPAQVPRRIRVVADLPRTATGKIARMALPDLEADA